MVSNCCSDPLEPLPAVSCRICQLQSLLPVPLQRLTGCLLQCLGQRRVYPMERGSQKNPGNQKKYQLQQKQQKDAEKREKYKLYGELINVYI